MPKLNQWLSYKLERNVNILVKTDFIFYAVIQIYQDFYEYCKI